MNMFPLFFSSGHFVLLGLLLEYVKHATLQFYIRFSGLNFCSNMWQKVFRHLPNEIINILPNVSFIVICCEWNETLCRSISKLFGKRCVIYMCYVMRYFNNLVRTVKQPPMKFNINLKLRYFRVRLTHTRQRNKSRAIKLLQHSSKRVLIA